MAYKKKYTHRRSNFRRRRTQYRKGGLRNHRKRRNYPPTMRNRQIGFSQRCIVHLKFAINFHVSGAFVTYNNNYIANTLFKPNATQAEFPMCVDQWKALYSNYRVFAMNWKVQYNNYNGQATCVVVAPQAASTAVFTDVRTACEQRGARTMYAVANTGIATMRGKYYLPRILGMTSSEYRGRQDTSGNLGPTPSNPVAQGFMNFGLFSIDGSTTISGDVMVEMIFHAELFNPIVQSLST